MIQIQIETDPEFVSPEKDICTLVLENVFNDQNITNANVTCIFGRDELLTRLKKSILGKTI